MNLLFVLISFLFPVRCVGCGRIGAFSCSACTAKINWVEHSICPYCKRGSIGGATHFSCRKQCGLAGLSTGFYFQGSIKKAVHQLKYREVTTLQETLVGMFVTSLEKQGFKFKDWVLVPIPLYKIRERKRDFNQAELLAQGLADKWGLALNQGLKRMRSTTTQVKLTEKERLQNLKGAFVVENTVILKGNNIILVDDVFTTGSTLFSGAEVLKKAGAKQVWGITLARAQSI